MKRKKQTRIDPARDERIRANIERTRQLAEKAQAELDRRKRER